MLSKHRKLIIPSDVSLNRCVEIVNRTSRKIGEQCLLANSLWQHVSVANEGYDDENHYDMGYNQTPLLSPIDQRRLLEIETAKVAISPVIHYIELRKADERRLSLARAQPGKVCASGSHTSDEFHELYTALGTMHRWLVHDEGPSETEEQKTLQKDDENQERQLVMDELMFNVKMPVDALTAKRKGSSMNLEEGFSLAKTKQITQNFVSLLVDKHEVPYSYDALLQLIHTFGLLTTEMFPYECLTDEAKETFFKDGCGSSKNGYNIAILKEGVERCDALNEILTDVPFPKLDTASTLLRGRKSSVRRGRTSPSRERSIVNLEARGLVTEEEAIMRANELLVPSFISELQRHIRELMLTWAQALGTYFLHCELIMQQQIDEELGTSQKNGAVGYLRGNSKEEKLASRRNSAEGVKMQEIVKEDHQQRLKEMAHQEEEELERRHSEYIQRQNELRRQEVEVLAKDRELKQKQVDMERRANELTEQMFLQRAEEERLRNKDEMTRLEHTRRMTEVSEEEARIAKRQFQLDVERRRVLATEEEQLQIRREAEKQCKEAARRATLEQQRIQEETEMADRELRARRQHMLLEAQEEEAKITCRQRQLELERQHLIEEEELQKRAKEEAERLCRLAEEQAMRAAAEQQQALALAERQHQEKIEVLRRQAEEEAWAWRQLEQQQEAREAAELASEERLFKERLEHQRKEEAERMRREAEEFAKQQSIEEEKRRQELETARREQELEEKEQRRKLEEERRHQEGAAKRAAMEQELQRLQREVENTARLLQEQEEVRREIERRRMEENEKRLQEESLRREAEAARKAEEQLLATEARRLREMTEQSHRIEEEARIRHEAELERQRQELETQKQEIKVQREEAERKRMEANKAEKHRLEEERKIERARALAEAQAEARAQEEEYQRKLREERLHHEAEARAQDEENQRKLREERLHHEAEEAEKIRRLAEFRHTEEERRRRSLEEEQRAQAIRDIQELHRKQRNKLEKVEEWHHRASLATNEDQERRELKKNWEGERANIRQKDVESVVKDSKKTSKRIPQPTINDDLMKRLEALERENQYLCRAVDGVAQNNVIIHRTLLENTEKQNKKLMEGGGVGAEHDTRKYLQDTQSPRSDGAGGSLAIQEASELLRPLNERARHGALSPSLPGSDVLSDSRSQQRIQSARLEKLAVASESKPDVATAIPRRAPSFHTTTTGTLEESTSRGYKHGQIISSHIGPSSSFSGVSNNVRTAIGDNDISDGMINAPSLHGINRPHSVHDGEKSCYSIYATAPCRSNGEEFLAANREDLIPGLIKTPVYQSDAYIKMSPKRKGRQADSFLAEMMGANADDKTTKSSVNRLRQQQHQHINEADAYYSEIKVDDDEGEGKQTEDAFDAAVEESRSVERNNREGLAFRPTSANLRAKTFRNGYSSAVPSSASPPSSVLRNMMSIRSQPSHASFNGLDKETYFQHRGKDYYNSVIPQQLEEERKQYKFPAPRSATGIRSTSSLSVRYPEMQKQQAYERARTAGAATSNGESTVGGRHCSACDELSAELKPDFWKKYQQQQVQGAGARMAWTSSGVSDSVGVGAGTAVPIRPTLAPHAVIGGNTRYLESNLGGWNMYDEYGAYQSYYIPTGDTLTGSRTRSTERRNKISEGCGRRVSFKSVTKMKPSIPEDKNQDSGLKKEVGQHSGERGGDLAFLVPEELVKEEKCQEYGNQIVMTLIEEICERCNVPVPSDEQLAKAFVTISHNEVASAGDILGSTQNFKDINDNAVLASIVLLNAPCVTLDFSTLAPWMNERQLRLIFSVILQGAQLLKNNKKSILNSANVAATLRIIDISRCKNVRSLSTLDVLCDLVKACPHLSHVMYDPQNFEGSSDKKNKKEEELQELLLKTLMRSH